ncbi:MAG TPA: tetratricopeptide repeat protein [Acidimicrobiales bacterium]|nr:tetratricopeptide repeat protein [Acidimicrobiales bacterium]
MVDVTDATFERDVLDRSVEVPVVVDLWAEWCGPCRTLGPIIERVVAATDGRVELVKVDVDANPRVSATFDVKSIPAVFALRDRRVVDSFIGALPEAQVQAFVDKLAPPATEVDRLLAAGDEASLRQALELDHDHPVAVLALAQVLIDGGEGEEALELLKRLPETADVRRVAAQARLSASTGEAGSDDDLERRFESLLARVKDDETARQQYLDMLEMLGVDDPRKSQYRRALAARLY